MNIDPMNPLLPILASPIIVLIFALAIFAIWISPRKKAENVFLGGLMAVAIVAVMYIMHQFDPMEHRERRITYCATHRGVVTLTSGFLGISHTYLCADGTTEPDRGPSETYDVPKKEVQ